MNPVGAPSRTWPDCRAQVMVLLLGVALAVFAADLNSWVIFGIGPTAVRAWKHDLGMPFELLWIVGLFVIGLAAGLAARPAKLSRSRVLLLLAGPFALSAFVGDVLAVFVFGVYPSSLEAAFMLLYPVALPVGVLVSINVTGPAANAA